jgi:hypothetical protein
MKLRITEKALIIKGGGINIITLNIYLKSIKN